MAPVGNFLLFYQLIAYLGGVESQLLAFQLEDGVGGGMCIPSVLNRLTQANYYPG